MKTTQLHTNYEHIETELLQAVANFDTTGAYVTKGDRNVIKKFNIDGVFYNIKKCSIIIPIGQTVPKS